ncbi:MAG: hypothetical protein WA102_07415 [Candidatus Methanoperedens sp.]
MLQYYLKPEYKEFLFKKIPESKRIHSVDLIKRPVKNLQEFFTSTSFKRDEWPYLSSELDHLVNIRIIDLIEEEGYYILTYKGLAILEYNLEFSDQFDSYLNDLNSLLFEKNLKTKYESLRPKDKVILFTVLGLYSFSPDLSLYVDESNKSEFAQSADFAVELLKKHHPEDVIDFDKIWDSKVVGEDSILSTLRRLDEIPKKTGNIFKVASGNKHGIYVDILKEDGSINEDRALFLLRKIFDNKIFDMVQKEKLIDTLNHIEKGHFSLIRSNNKINRIKIKIQLRDIIFEKL